MAQTVKARKRNTANLRPPWQPGQSGNPKGRPKLTIEQQHLQPYKDAWPEVAAQRIVHAKDGCCRCMTAIEERLFGKPTQPVDVNLPDALRFIAEETGADPEAVRRRYEELQDKMRDRGWSVAV